MRRPEWWQGEYTRGMTEASAVGRAHEAECHQEEDRQWAGSPDCLGTGQEDFTFLLLFFSQRMWMLYTSVSVYVRRLMASVFLSCSLPYVWKLSSHWNAEIGHQLASLASHFALEFLQCLTLEQFDSRPAVISPA